MNIQLSKKLTSKILVGFCKSKGYTLYGVGNSINIINVRSNQKHSNYFDDIQVVLMGYDSKAPNPTANARSSYFSVTTDPGYDSLIKPINSKGTAIVVPGQYPQVWQLGLHKGQYDALVQASDIIVVRDNNKDSMLDTDINFKEVLKGFVEGVNKIIVESFDKTPVLIEKGLFGINCHRASKWKILDKVGLYSAGCCVHQNPDDYDKFIDLCKSASNKFISAIWCTEEEIDEYILTQLK